MKVTLPERVTGSKDQLFVLEVEFPVTSVERGVEVEATGPVEPLDLSGTSRGGSYRIPVGLERLHVPLRVTADGAGESAITVRCADGPEAPLAETRTVRLEAPLATAGAGRRRLVGGLLAVAAVAAVAFGASKLLGGKQVPDVRGLTLEAAEARLAEAGLKAAPRSEPAASPEEENRVVRQIPKAGADLPASRTVELVVGESGDRLVPVPTVVGEEADTAVSVIKASGFRELVTFEPVTDATQVNRVLNQSPDAGTRLEPRQTVQIWVGRGAPVPTVPDVVGLEPDEALARLVAAGFVGAVTPGEEVGPDRVGQVLRQSTLPGEALAAGGTVTVWVGRARAAEPPPVVPPPPPGPEPAVPLPPAAEPVRPVPPTPPPTPEPHPTGRPPVPTPGADGKVAVPDMTGWTRAEAEDFLGRAGLTSMVILVPSSSPDQAGAVLGQRPRAGERVQPSSMISLQIGERFDGAAPPPSRPTPPPPAPEPPAPEPPAPEPSPLLPPTPEPPTPAPPTPAPPTPAPPGPGPGPSRPVAARPGSVPDLVGLSRLQAEGQARTAGYRYRIVLKVTEFPADGTVVSQEPAPGDPLEAGGEVVLEVARRPPDALISVPEVTGMDRTTAERMLRNAGFLVRVTYGGGRSDQQGLVLAQAPPSGAQGPDRSWVEIVIAQGSGPTPVPVGGPPPFEERAVPRPPTPSGSGELSRPPSVGAGPVLSPPPTPRAAAPLPPVPLPPRDAPRTATVPDVSRRTARQAITAVLEAGLLPILELDRTGSAAAEEVLRQQPAAGTAVLPGDLVRLSVSVGPRANERHVDMPMAIGADLARARTQFAGRHGVQVVEIRVPTHPYAGTGRVAAQYPVSSVPLSQAQQATLWIVTR